MLDEKVSGPASRVLEDAYRSRLLALGVMALVFLRTHTSHSLVVMSLLYQGPSAVILTELFVYSSHDFKGVSKLALFGLAAGLGKRRRVCSRYRLLEQLSTQTDQFAITSTTLLKLATHPQPNMADRFPSLEEFDSGGKASLPLPLPPSSSTSI
jgi:hypothetical protein